MFLNRHVRIFVASDPTDMRKGFDGLAGEVRHRLGGDPLSGSMFVFFNRRRTQVKILYFDVSGYCVWTKRLEAGVFEAKASTQSGPLEVNASELLFILEGVDLGSVRYRRRYSLDEMPCNRQLGAH